MDETQNTQDNQSPSPTPPQPVNMVAPDNPQVARAPEPAPMPMQQAYQPMPPPVIKKKSKKLFVSLVLLMLLLVGAAAGYWLFLREKPASSPVASNQTEASETQGEKTEELKWTPFKEGTTDGLTMVHDASWSSNAANNKYWSITRGLIKNSSPQKYVITMAPSESDGKDYLNRASGGAYPPGTLYKSVETRGAGTMHVATFSIDGGTQAYVSTCPPTANGGCSLDIGSGSLWVIELHRYDESKDTDVMNVAQAFDPLVLTNAADQQVLDEFVAMVATIVL